MFPRHPALAVSHSGPRPQSVLSKFQTRQCLCVHCSEIKGLSCLFLDVATKPLGCLDVNVNSSESIQGQCSNSQLCPKCQNFICMRDSESRHSLHVAEGESVSLLNSAGSSFIWLMPVLVSELPTADCVGCRVLQRTSLWCY